jgi:uncharacterized membrane protein YfcA
MDAAHVALIAAAACAAGTVNAVAGGGSLISFPVLVYAGLGNVTASMTNSVAMCPGYFSATLAQRHDLAGQRKRIAQLLPLSIAGSFIGAYLLLTTSERSFTAGVPWLQQFAAQLLAVQVPLGKHRLRRRHVNASNIVAALPVGLAAIYGAYFGAGLGVMILAVLGVLVSSTLARANALKQLLSLVIDLIAAGMYIARGHVAWEAAAIVALGSLAGGAIGGKLASHLPEVVLRSLAISIAVVVALIYFAREYA